MCITQSGSQIQNKSGELVPTVQGSLNEALSRIFRMIPSERLRVALSSRTDANVHALRTGVHFDLPALCLKPSVPDIKKKLNTIFKKNDLELRVLNVIPVSDEFNARSSALEKTYTYRIGVLKKDCASDYSEPISEINRTYFMRCGRFNSEKVKEILPLYEGEKDFAAFVKNLAEYTGTTICRINSFTFTPCHPLMPGLDDTTHKFDFYQFQCSGNRFLYQMVRRLVASVLAFACDRLTLSEVKSLFNGPNLQVSSKCNTVPGYGLYLSNVVFNPEHLKFTEEERLLKIEEANKLRSQSIKNTSVAFEGFKNFMNKIER